MQFQDIRKDYYLFSGKTSDIVRHLAFAGIAAVWIYRVGQPAGICLPSPLRGPLLLFLVALALDLLQYTVQSATWRIYYGIRESQGVQDEDEVDVPTYLNWAPTLIFWTKIGCVMLGYVLAVVFIAHTIEWN